MARAGLAVAYATAVGDDPYSDGIVALARAEGIDATLITRCPGRMPGLYLIETTASGERTFHYWRERSPAREVFDPPVTAPLLEAIRHARLVYISGITLSLYSQSALDELWKALSAARSAGTAVAMDGNYRPRGWNGDRSRASEVMERFWRLTTVALPTFDDEMALWRDSSPAATIERLRGFGCREIALKLGPDGALVAADGTAPSKVPVDAIVSPVDTTAAGDSFNAAYLAARSHGVPAWQAAAAGHRLAAVVISHRGAIVPADATRQAMESISKS
jgi:2-dehydro-3-deoxygluconokinase